MHHGCLQAQILVCSKSFARHKLNQIYINLRDEKGNAKRRLTKNSEILGRPVKNGEGRVKSHAAFKPYGYRMRLRERCHWVIGVRGKWMGPSQTLRGTAGGWRHITGGFWVCAARTANARCDPCTRHIAQLSAWSSACRKRLSHNGRPQRVDKHIRAR
jgi:hypothetical protein